MIYLFIVQKDTDENEEGMEIDLEAVTQQQEENLQPNVELEKQKVLVNYLKVCMILSYQLFVFEIYVCTLNYQLKGMILYRSQISFT